MELSVSQHLEASLRHVKSLSITVDAPSKTPTELARERNKDFDDYCKSIEKQCEGQNAGTYTKIFFAGNGDVFCFRDGKIYDSFGVKLNEL